MYQTLLFDVDDTVLDFQAGEMRSLRRTLSAFALPDTPAIESAYLALNAGLWRDYEAGRIGREQIFKRRFTQLAAQFNWDIDGMALERYYHRLLDQEAVIGPRVAETLAALSDYRLFIVSNGIEPVQQARLTKAGLIDAFEAVFVSDTIGAPKPTLAFFDYVAKHVAGFNPKTALIIGDSLTSDIQGGVNAGIDTVWFNPHLVPNRSAVVPTYTLSDFSDLTRVVGQ